MLGRAQAVILTANQADADLIAGQITAEIATRNPSRIDVAPTPAQKGNRIAVLVHVEFSDKTVAQDFLSALKTKMESSPKALSGSRIVAHACRHDEGVGECLPSDVDYRVWVKP